MKKVLLGLVIAVMMTSSGYSEYKWDEKNSWDEIDFYEDRSLGDKQSICQFAHARAVGQLGSAKYTHDNLDSRATYYKGFHFLEAEKELIEKAEAYAVVYSILCKD